MTARNPLPDLLTALTVMRDAPVLPVIVIDDAAHALPMARALLAGGIRMLEVTLRTSAALAAIEAIARELPEVAVGAGTVRSASDVRAACDAGARFAVSPGWSAAVGQACRQAGVPWLPGVATPSELMAATDDGWRELKFFPAQQAGGTGMLRALAGPFPEVRFCPTGGITQALAREYLALPNVVCVGGSWVVPPEALAQGDWARIERLARDAAALTPLV